MSEETLVATLRAEIAQFRAQMAEAQQLMTRMGQEATQASTRMQGSFQTLTGSVGALKTVLASLGLLVVARELVHLAGIAIQASTQITVLQNAFKTITGSSTAAAQELAFVRAEAQRLGVSFLPAAEGFRNMVAAAKGTEIAGAGVRTIFTAITEASRVMGLGTDQTSRVLVGIQQIMGKGVVQMEEWRQQIGEALPQATQVMARALGVTTQEFFKMVEQGRVGLPELVRFAEQLRREVADGVATAAQTFQAETARMGTAWTELMASLGTLITTSPGVLEALRSITQVLASAAVFVTQHKESWQQWLDVAGRVIARANELAQQTFFPKQSDEFTTQINEAQRQIDTFSAQLVELQRIGNNPAARFLHDLFGPAVAEDITRVTTELANLRAEMARLQTARMLALRTEQGLGPLGGLGVPEGDLGEMLGVGRDPFAGQGKRLAATGVDLNATKKILTDIATLQETLTVGMVNGQRLTADQTALLNQELEKELKTLEKIRDPKADERRQEAKRQAKEAETEAKRLAREAEQDLIRFEQHLDSLVGLNPFAGLVTDITALEKRFQEAELPGEIDAIVKAIVRLQEQQNALQGVANLANFGDSAEELAKGTKAAEEYSKALEKVKDKEVEAAKELVDVQFELREVYANTTEEKLALLRDYAQALEAAGMKEADITKMTLRRQTSITKDELEKQQKEWEHFTERVHDTLADNIFAVLSGQIKTAEDLFERLKATFFRVMADMAAKALTPIVINFVGQTMEGLFGRSGAPSMGGSGSLSQGALQQFGILAPQTGGPAVGTVGAGSMSGSPYVWTGSGWAAMRPGESPGTFGYGAPAGGAVGQFQGGNYAGAAMTGAGAIGAGVSTGYLLMDVNESMGLGGRGGQALAGAGAGALAGTMIMPGWGTLIGAVVGAIAGAVIHVARAPFLDVKTAELVVGLQDDLLTIVSNNITAVGKGLPGSMAEVADQLEMGIAGAIQPFLDTINTMSPRIRQSLLGQVNTFADGLETMLTGPEFEVAKDQGTEFMQAFLGKKIPELMQGAFGPLFEALQQVGPLVQGYRDALTALKQRQEQLLASITGQRQALIEALMSPAEIFEARKAELTALMTTWRSASSAAQLQMIPELQTLIGDVMQRGQGQEVLGQDPGALRVLQHDLLGFLDEIERGSTAIFTEQISAAETQIAVLEDSLLHLASIDAVLKESHAALQRLNTFMQTAFSAGFQEGGPVLRTGFAMVHAGEQVLPVGAGPITVNLTVHSSAPSTPGLGQDIERIVVEKIIPQLRLRQRLGQY